MRGWSKSSPEVQINSELPRYGIWLLNSGVNERFRLHTWAVLTRPALLYG